MTSATCDYCKQEIKDLGYVITAYDVKLLHARNHITSGGIYHYNCIHKAYSIYEEES